MNALGCRLAMYIWHAMFGEALRLPRRQRDVRLPLFMKIQNVEARPGIRSDPTRLCKQLLPACPPYATRCIDLAPLAQLKKGRGDRLSSWDPSEAL